jgi:hypothetical protein
MTETNLYREALEALLLHLAQPEDEKRKKRAADALDAAHDEAGFEMTEAIRRVEPPWKHARGMVNTWFPGYYVDDAWPIC